MSHTQLQIANLGFPRMGEQRELKFALEAFWRGERTEQELQTVAQELRARHWKMQKARGIAHIPSNDFSLYDQVLDMLVAVGATPERFGAGAGKPADAVTLPGYFAMARNSQQQTAMEMTKWFDTNYHYLQRRYAQDCWRICRSEGAWGADAASVDWAVHTAVAGQAGRGRL
jgi:5-methyltetrahydropteroyltriglutamate--homocysteine methyltransferase